MGCEGRTNGPVRALSQGRGKASREKSFGRAKRLFLAVECNGAKPGANARGSAGRSKRKGKKKKGSASKCRTQRGRRATSKERKTPGGASGTLQGLMFGKSGGEGARTAEQKGID